MRVSERAVKRLGFLTVAIVFALSFFRGFGIGLGYSVVVTPVDIAIGLLGLAWVVIVVLKGELTLARNVMMALVLAIAFVIYLSILSLSSPLRLRALTLILLTVRDILLFAILVTTLNASILPAINRAVYAIASLAAFGMLLVYAYALAFGLNSLGPFEATVFREYVTLFRAQWFVADPNFFGFFLMVGLFSGFYHAWTKRSFKSSVGLVVIIPVLFLAFSRTIFLLLVGALVIAGSHRFFTNKHWLETRSLGVIFIAILSGGIIAGLAGDTLIFRFTHVSFARLKLWAPLIRSIDPLSAIFGHGLRAAEVAIGRYPHNSYLELWYDTGVIGLGLYLLIVVVIALPVFRKWIRGECEHLTPWWYALLATLGFLFPFSFQYQPMVWLVLGIVGAGFSGRMSEVATSGSGTEE